MAGSKNCFVFTLVSIKSHICNCLKSHRRLFEIKHRQLMFVLFATPTTCSTTDVRDYEMQARVSHDKISEYVQKKRPMLFKNKARFRSR